MTNISRQITGFPSPSVDACGKGLVHTEDSLVILSLMWKTARRHLQGGMRLVARGLVLENDGEPELCPIVEKCQPVSKRSEQTLVRSLVVVFCFVGHRSLLRCFGSRFSCLRAMYQPQKTNLAVLL